MSNTLLVTPRMSEKTYAVSELLNTYVFNVPAGANKQSVAEAVASQFKVTVENVRIANIGGKSKKSYKKRGRALPIKRNNISKAYVTLKDGDKLPFFASAEAEAEKPAKETK